MSEDDKEKLKESAPELNIHDQKRATPEDMQEAYKSLGEPIQKIIEILNSEELHNPDRALLAHTLFSYILMHIGLTGYERIGVIGFIEHDIHAWIDYLKMQHTRGAMESEFKKEMERQMEERGDNPFLI